MDNEMMTRLTDILRKHNIMTLPTSFMIAKEMIKAMREPTMEMTMKGNLAIAADMSADLVFKNMIDAIVNE